jgi:oligosaccharide 4-alpha-D-glucosyltransferase
MKMKLMFIPKVLVLLCTIIFSASVFAGYIGHQVNGNSISIHGQVNGEKKHLTLTAHHSHALEVLFDNSHHLKLPSYSITNSHHVSLGITDTSNFLTIDTGSLVAKLDKKSMVLSYFRGEDLLITEEKGFSTNSESIELRFYLSEGEQMLGGGQRVLGMDRRGQVLPLYNKAHYGYTTESKQMYYGLPGLMSDKKYMVIFDNTARGQMDIGASESDILSFNAVSGRSSYLIVSGHSYPHLINNYVELTGKQPMPPRWALGNFASRFGYHDEKEVRQTVQAFKDDDIPLDALVLDLYWFGKEVKGTMGNLAWDKDSFPEPEKMIADLKQQGVKTVVITEPFVLTTSNKWDEAKAANALATQTPIDDVEIDQAEPYTFDFFFGNTGLIDLFSQKGRDWFNQTYKMLHKQGVSGWWGDLGEPEVHPDEIQHQLDSGLVVSGETLHNVYGHKWAEMVYNNHKKIAPNERPMIMMRSGFIGSQRYGMIPWTGDVSRSWGGLKPQVELSLQMGLFGLAYTHSDLGGFAGGDKFDAEMYTRWLQYGVFQPVYRPHAQEHIAPEPVFHDKKTKDIVREFIKLRYQLLPYNYTLAYQNSTTGMPLMRPLFFENEQNKTLVAEKNTFLWGDSFLVTPVTEANVNSVKVNVPEGVWFDWWSGTRVDGGEIIDYSTSLETIPVLVRAGSFIPMIASIHSTEAYTSKKLALHYYHDNSVLKASGQMYEDDGESANAIDSKAFDLLDFKSDFKQSNTQHQLHINVTRQGNGYEHMPSSRELTLTIHNWKSVPTELVVSNQNIPIVQSERALKIASQAALYNSVDKSLTIKYSWSMSHNLVITSPH